MRDLIIFEFKYDFCNDMCVNGYEKKMVEFEIILCILLFWVLSL